MTSDQAEQDDPSATRPLHGAEDFGAAALRLLEAARGRVRIVPQRADLRYLSDDPVVAALRALLIGRRHARLEMLLPPNLARDDLGRPLWDLARRLSSAVTVHRLGDEDGQLAEAWLTVDQRAYLHRPQAERLSGQACLNDPPRAKELNQRFDALWLASEPDPDVRRLSL